MGSVVTGEMTMVKRCLVYSLTLCLSALALVACDDAPPVEPVKFAPPVMPTVDSIEFATTVAIGSNPFTAQVMAHAKVERVHYYIDGVKLGEATESPTFPYDIQGLDTGSYQLRAEAFDAVGTHVGDAVQTLQIVDNAAIEIHLPVQDSPGLFTLETTVIGPVHRIEYYLNGQSIGQSSAANNGFAMTVPVESAGTHVIAAEAYNSDGHRLATATKTFILAESPEGTVSPPAVIGAFEFLTPTGASTSPLTLSVSAPYGTMRVDYWIGDDQHLGTSISAESNFSLFVAELEPGKYPITARAMAYDGTFIGDITEAITVIEAPAELIPVEPEEAESTVKAVNADPNVSVKLVSFNNGQAHQGVPTLLKVTTSGSVAKVEYWNGNTPIAVSKTGYNGFATTFTFWTLGPRTLTAKAFNSNGQLVALNKTLLMVVKAPANAEPPPNDPPAQPTPPPAGGTPTCKAGELVDCNGNCAKAAYVADGYCDDGKKYPSNFMCPELGMDGNDCGAQGQSPCSDGKILDCLGQCAKASWINDGTCDNGKTYKIDFMCAERGFDGNDCGGQANPAQPPAPTPEPPPAAPVNGGLNVPYFYQYNNSLSPGASCQNTSIAMVLKYYGWSGTPDTITSAWGKNHAQSPAGLAQVFNSYAKNAGIKQRIQHHTNGTIGGLKSLLAQGKPVIIHGYFTGFGHVLVVTGYKNGKYIVNDPAGKWNQSFKGGYPYGGGSNAGKGISYGAAAFEQAVATLNGSGFAPMWYHEIIQ